MPAPPGLRRLITILPILVAPPALTTGALLFLKQHNVYHASPTWVIGLAGIVVYPVILYAHCYVCRFIDWREARKYGAVLPTLVPDTGFTVMQKSNTSFERGYPADDFTCYVLEYGKNILSFNFLGNKLVFTVEPHHIKAILATQFESFEKGPTVFQQFGSFLGVGIFNSDGDMWRFHRTMTRPFFTKERISDFEIYATTSDRALDEAQNRLAEGYSIDFQDLVGRFTLDSATVFLTGRSVNSLNAGLPYPPHSSHKNPLSFVTNASTLFLNAFNKGLYLTALRLGLGDDWPLFEFWKDEAGECRKEINKFVEPIVEQALEERDRILRVKGGGAGDGKREEGETLLAHLVNHTQDSKILTDELLNLLVAGRDTTMSLISSALYMIIEHPDVEQKLRQEVFDKVGSHATPTYENVKDMGYMRAFLNEVLRLYPPVPANARFSKNAAVFESPKGSSEPPIYLSSGTTVVYSVLHMQRRKDLWGPDALEFDPDRFLDERLQKYLVPNPYIFSPFNAGPRICLGQQFAYHQATFFFVRLLQRFTKFKLDEEKGVNTPPPREWKAFEGPQGRDRVMLQLSLTMSIRGGLWVTMEELNSDVPLA